MMKSLFTLLVIALPLITEDKKPDGDKTKLQGTWTLVAMEVNGTKVPPKSETLTFTFEGDKVTAKSDGEAKPATFKLDPAQKPPQIDVVPEGKDFTVKMLYQIDGDTLKIYGGMGDKSDRPASYDKAVTVLTLKREKK